jgi:tRNA modification GTPase
MLRLSGEQAINIARKMSPTIDTWEHSRAVVGHLYRSDGQVLDQAVITTFYAPRSFTGEHTVEFSCHGNPLIVDAIVNLAIEYGARLANPGEFMR